MGAAVGVGRRDQPARRVFVEHHEILGRRDADHDFAQLAPFMVDAKSSGHDRTPRSAGWASDGIHLAFETGVIKPPPHPEERLQAASRRVGYTHRAWCRA